MVHSNVSGAARVSGCGVEEAVYKSPVGDRLGTSCVSGRAFECLAITGVANGESVVTLVES